MRHFVSVCGRVRDLIHGLARAALLAAFCSSIGAQEIGKEAGDANLKGGRHRLAGEYAEALREFNRVIELEPNSRFGWYNRGLVRRDMGDCRSALEDFNEALRRDPEFFGALYHRGNCRQQLGRFKEAIEDYSTALRLPGRVDGRFLAQYARGDALRRSGDLEGALADYNRVSEQRADTTVLRSRAWVHLYLGHASQAFEDAEKFLKQGDAKESNSAYVALLGYIARYRTSGRAEAARFLGEWAPRFAGGGWPAPVFKYLAGELDQAGLLKAASNAAERTEALAYAGMAQAIKGDAGNAGEAASGAKLLAQVVKEGDPRYWEYDLAFYELKRRGLASVKDRRKLP